MGIMKTILLYAFFTLIFNQTAFAMKTPGKQIFKTQRTPSVKLSKIKSKWQRNKTVPLVFDIPVTYNRKVQRWIKFFQTKGKTSFTIWLERSSKYLPQIRKTLRSYDLPEDLAYIAMIESGFSPFATSHAKAVGPWQFIKATGLRYGLTITWWLDERRDFDKSTKAAARYISDLYRMFDSWYLAAAAYNAGENRIRRHMRKHGTRNFWILASKKGMPKETRNYVPRLIAALLISKAPRLYGFRNLKMQKPLEYDHFRVPGGTSLKTIAKQLGISHKTMKNLNPELIKGFVPQSVSGHLIRIPKNKISRISAYMRDRTSAKSL